jgi:hypothetical protein
MPPLDGFNLLTVKGSGTALLESSTMPAQPILTVGTYGKGRVLALATDYFWKWNAGMVAAGKDNWVYLRFVERVVRWLTRDPALEPVTLLVPDKPGEAGQDVDVRINPVEDDTRSRETVLFSVFNPEGVKIRSQLRTAGTAGALVGTFRPEKKGMYRVRVETRAGSVEETVVVSGFMEGLDAAPDHEALRATSASTGGKLISQKEDAAAEVAAYMGKAQKRFIEERQVPLWGTPYLLALIIALLALEWYLRRRWGLV